MVYDKKFIIDSIKKLSTRYGTHEAFRDVVTCCAYSFANGVEFKDDREKEYLRIINKYSEEERNIFPKILTALVNEYTKAEEPIDILGDIYEELNLTKKGAAQFFTPLDVCKLMAKVTIDKKESEKSIKENGYINVSDPACGSGRNLYAAYSELLNNDINNNKILLVGDDLDLTCCCMTYIQLSLMGANAIVHHQDSLTMNRYDTFYTVSYAMNKELQNNLFKGKETGDEIEV
ncbi:MAG: N-6 DNA methylase [Bacilli bacterium]